MYFSESVRTAFGDEHTPDGHFMVTVEAEAANPLDDISPHFDRQELVALCRSAIETLAHELATDGYRWLPVVDDANSEVFSGVRYLVHIVYLPAIGNETPIVDDLNGMTTGEVETALRHLVADTLSEVFESIATSDLDRLHCIMPVRPQLVPLLVGSDPDLNRQDVAVRWRRLMSYLTKLAQAQTEMRRRSRRRGLRRRLV